MAPEQHNDGFRLSFDEAPEDDDPGQIRSEIEDLKVEKLSQRVTIITILIPILIVVILGVTYLDIKRRVISTETSGSQGFENLSRDLESRFSSLSLRQAKLEEDYGKERERLDTASAAMGVRIKETEAALTSLTAVAITQEALKESATQTLAALDKRLAPLTQQIESTRAQLTAQGQDSVARLSELEGLIATMDPVLADLRRELQSLSANLDTLSSRLETLSEEKISKEQMELALKLDRLRIISDLQTEDKRLAQQLGEVSRQLTVVRGELTDLENRLYPQRRRSVAPQPAPKPPSQSPSQSPAAENAITEQDLQ